MALQIPMVANATFIANSTSTATITTSSPLPTNFNLLYSNSTSGSAPTIFYGRAVNLTDTDSTAVCFNSDTTPIDLWSLTTTGMLEDMSDNDDFGAKNTYDLSPWLFLVNSSTTANTPMCIGCDGALLCNYPNTTGNEFAVCQGCLALGPPGSLDAATCTPITLRYDEVGAA